MKQLAMLLCYTLGISAALTPYASGPSAIFYGSGYIPTRDFWRLGLVFAAIFLVVFLGMGVRYLGWYLGYWPSVPVRSGLGSAADASMRDRWHSSYA